MEWSGVKDLMFRSRSMREIGIALVGTSFVLAFFLILPLTRQAPSKAEVVVAEPAPAPVTIPSAFDTVPIHATAAIVYDLSTGQPLFEKNADSQLPLASLTKLLAVYTALATLPESSPITIPSSVAALEYPRAFTTGQVLELGDLSRLTLTASLNDGAAAIVEAAARKQNKTQAQALTDTAQALKLTQTYAHNGSGLDMTSTISGAYGSARDMALLAGALVMQAPEIAAATIYESASATAEDGQQFRVKNTDPIVDTIPHLLLSKTGFTDLAGGNLALVIDVGINHHVAIVVLGSSREARFTDGSALVAATLAHYAGVPSL